MKHEGKWLTFDGSIGETYLNCCLSCNVLLGRNLINLTKLIKGRFSLLFGAVIIVVTANLFILFGCFVAFHKTKGSVSNLDS